MPRDAAGHASVWASRITEPGTSARRAVRAVAMTHSGALANGANQFAVAVASNARITVTLI